MNTKYIFVTGGVVSGLGKGITAASLGRLLKNRGYKVTIQKFDPYLNVDPGTMSPYEHGEVFVTDDGAETDLDLGHYERFIDENLTKDSSITMGKIYLEVLEKEREGEYLGKTVQVIPHVTNKIKEKIYSFENTDTDIVITEIGGTVGDIEGLSIIEAIRQVGLEKNPEDVLYIHVTLLPYISGSNEIKSKPTQHSVKELQSYGIKPNILVCRSEIDIPDSIREKLALFCNVRKENVIQNKTVKCLYEVPLMLEREGLGRAVCNQLRLDNYIPDNSEWQEMINKIENIKDIDSHKKSIFEFWKYSNKDEVSQLPEGEAEEINVVKKITKVFDYDEDIEYFGKKYDRLLRKELTQDESDALFITNTNVIDLLNQIKTNTLEPKELENYLKMLKKEAIEQKSLLDNEEFDIFGGIADDSTKIKKIKDKKHRELPKDKFKILDINKNTKQIGFKLILEQIIDNIKNSLEKSKVEEDMAIYKAIADGEYISRRAGN